VAGRRIVSAAVVVSVPVLGSEHSCFNHSTTIPVFSIAARFVAAPQLRSIT
jgi:hypothetical protein